MYLLSFFVAIAVFIDVYLIDRKIMRPENIDYKFTESTQEKYGEFYKENLYNIVQLIEYPVYKEKPDILKTNLVLLLKNLEIIIGSEVIKCKTK